MQLVRGTIFMWIGVNESNVKFFPEGYVAKIKHGNESFWCQYPWNFIQNLAAFRAKCCSEIMSHDSWFMSFTLSLFFNFYSFNIILKRLYLMNWAYVANNMIAFWHINIPRAPSTASWVPTCTYTDTKTYYQKYKLHFRFQVTQ